MNRRLLFALGIGMALILALKPLLALLLLAAAGGWLMFRRGAEAARRGQADWLDALSAAQASLDRGDFTKALLLFEKAGWLAPGEAGTAHSELKISLGKARALLGLGRKDEAAPILKETIGRASALPGEEAAAIAKTARGLLAAAAEK